MNTESALEEAKREAKAGNKRRARDILREAAKLDPRNEDIFLLFAQVAIIKKDLQYYWILKEFLRMKRDN